jgi:hypothetical protein
MVMYCACHLEVDGLRPSGATFQESFSEYPFFGNAVLRECRFIFFDAPHVRRDHLTVVSDASLRLLVLDKSICLFSENIVRVQN